MNEKQEYLNEENYQKTNRKVKWGGRITILIGISMILIGIFVIKVPDMSADGWFEASTTRMFLIFPGIFLTIVGCMVRFIFANERKFFAYQMQQLMPLTQEGTEKMAPTIGKTAEEIVKGIKKGLNSEDTNKKED